MSIIRLSVLKDTVFAPSLAGNIDMAPYNRRRRTGRMESLPEPEMARSTSTFRHYLDHAVAANTAALAPDAPIVILVHGFLFDPKQAVSPVPHETDNPHGRVYHFQAGDEAEEQRHHTSSWPLGLDFADNDDGASGLAIALGWQSQPGFATSLLNHFQNFYARAYENAGATAWTLVNIVDALGDLLPGHPVHLMCHSLGSRVVVRALALACKHGRSDLIARLGNVLILGGAEYVVEAQLLQRRLEATGADRLPAIYNFVSRENDVLDKLGENFGPRTFGNTNVIGHNGLDTATRPDNWIDLQIDGPALQKWMAEQHNFEISGDRPGNVWDHWYYYTFRGNMALYAAILRKPEAWRIGTLRNSVPAVPDGVSRRWSLFGD